MPEKNEAIKRKDISVKEPLDCFQHPRFSEFESQMLVARPRLSRLARLRGIPSDAVEDVVQETLLEAWKHLDRLHTPDGFHAWLDEICRNICRRHARKQLSDQRHIHSPFPPYPGDAGEDGETGTAFLKNIPDPDLSDPLEALNRQDLTLLLDRAFGSLPESGRQAMELCYLLELPQREAALRLGLTISALEARLHRARRQLREVLNGSLREDAQALGLALDPESVDEWHETRLWCTLCGQSRLSGMFLPQPDGGTNLHMCCPDCEQRYGLTDIHNSNVHSKGLVPLAGLQSFRPAWKRTMQEMTSRISQTLLLETHPCLYCGTPTALQLIDKAKATEIVAEPILPEGLSRHPYQFWVRWKCPLCHSASSVDASVFAACDLVYWSHPRTRHFMVEHPRWINAPELLIEYAGQPAIRFQMADVTGAARLTVLAHRESLSALAVF